MKRERECFYFMGVDPAPSEGQKSDDGAIVILRGTPKDMDNISANYTDWHLDAVHARRVRKGAAGKLSGLSAREWGGLTHRAHQNFKLAKICMDWNGGGNFIMRELKSNKTVIDGNERAVVPIVTREETSVAVAHTILCMFKRGDADIEMVWEGLSGDDNLNDALYAEVKEALDLGAIAFPRPFGDWPREEMEGWSEEKVWALKCLTILQEQLAGIQVATKEDGSWLTTRHGARQFSSTKKKDFVSALLYAYAAFRVWLAGADEDWFGEGSGEFDMAMG